MSNQHRKVTAARLKRYIWLLAVVWTVLFAGALIGDITGIREHIATHFVMLVGLWASGIIGVVWGGRRLITQMRGQEQVELAFQQERQLFVDGSVVVFKWQNQPGWPVAYVSGNVAQVLGYSVHQFVSGDISFSDLIHPKDIERVTAEVQTGSRDASGRFSHQPYRVTRQDGQVIWLADYTTIIRDKTGQISHYLGYVIDITDRIDAEQALRVSEERLSLVLDGAKLGMWDWNVQTGDVVFNERWAGMLGYTLAEIDPHVDSWGKLLHPDDGPPVMAALNAHLAGQTPLYQTEHRLRHKSGRWVWVFDSGKVVERDDAGRPVRATGIHLDITDRKQAEMELQAAEARNRVLVDAIPDVLFVLDSEGVFLDCKAPAESELFAPPEQFVGRPAAKVMPPDLAEQAMQKIRQTLQTGQVQTYRYQLLYPGDELPHHFEARIGRVNDKQVLAVVRDVTKPERTLAALQASRASLAKAQQIAHVGNWEWNIQTDESIWSDEHYRIFGITPQQYGGTLQSFLSFIHPDDRARVSGAVDEALYGGQPYSFDCRIIRPDGSTRIVHEQGEVLYDDDTGQPLKMLGTTQDVTEEKEAEAALKSWMSRLETLIHSLHSGILLEDVHRRVILHNQAFNGIFGMPDSMDLEGLDCEVAAAETKAMFAEPEQLVSRISDIVQQQQPVAGDELHTVDGRVIERDYVPVYSEGQLMGHLWHYRDITERVHTSEQIKASLQEKEVLLKEIHHRVKNNLQIVASLLYLQSSRINDAATLAAFQESRDRIRSMALIHEQLYMSRNLAAIDFHHYLSSLVAYLAQTYRSTDSRIDVYVQAKYINLAVDTAIPLGLIVNELVSNALKHAFPQRQSGQVTVELTRTGPTICMLSVQDNGVGMAPEAVDRLSREGLREVYGNSLGVQLVDMLAQQLDGKITIRNHNGTTFEITFPLPA